MKTLTRKVDDIIYSFQTIQDTFRENPTLETISFKHSTFCDDGMMILDIYEVKINGKLVIPGDEWVEEINPNLLGEDEASTLEGCIFTLLISDETTVEEEVLITRDILNINYVVGPRD